MPHSASRSAHGVVHWPTNTLPKPPCMPTAELRDAKLEVCATLFERSIEALVSPCAHALNPPPRLSRALTPMLEACEATSHFDTEAGPPAPVVSVPASYFILLTDMWMVPYTSTCASAAAGAANAPVTASAKIFFCISIYSSPL